MSTVPVVHNWIGPAFAGWTRSVYPRRHVRVPHHPGIYMLVWGLVQIGKLMIWFGGAALIFEVFLLTALLDLATYPIRRPV